MPNLSRQQVIAWSVLGAVILLIGANYLRGQIDTASPGGATPRVAVSTGRSQPSTIKVHVTGAVARPGLYEIGGGQRVDDAIRLAGGATPDADLNQINLAARLADGQQVLVPVKGVAGPVAAAGGSSAAGAAPSSPINLNSATADQLESLDGIGAKTAQKIIDYRNQHGGFKSVDELLDVPGIGPAKFDQIKSQVCV